MWVDEIFIETKLGKPIKLKYNHDLSYEIWKARGGPKRSVELTNHPLLGKKIFNKKREPISETNKYGNIGIVESVTKDWLAGYYISILINYDGSHGFNMWENINSISEVVSQSIEKNHNFLTVL